MFSAGELIAIQNHTGVWAWLELEARLAGRELRLMTRDDALTRTGEELRELKSIIRAVGAQLDETQSQLASFGETPTAEVVQMAPSSARFSRDGTAT